MWRFPGLSFPQWLLHPSHSLWLSCPAAALGAMGTSKKRVPGMYFKCVGTQRHELGYSWRGCDQERGRQGAGVAELGSTETTTFCCSWQGGWNTGLLYTIVLLGVKTLKQLSHTQSCISMSQLKSVKYRAVVLLQWFVEKKITWFLNHFYNSF